MRSGKKTFLSMREHPGCLFGLFCEGGGEHMPCEDSSGLVAPRIGFASGGLGAGDSKAGLKLPTNRRPPDAVIPNY